MPEASPTQREVRSQPGVRENDARIPTDAASPSCDALGELSEASERYPRWDRAADTDNLRQLRRRPRVSLVLPIFGALGVGFVLLIAGRNVYRCGAIFRLGGEFDSDQRTLCRNTLYNVASAGLAIATPADESSGRRGFFVDSPTPAALRFAFETRNATTAQTDAKRVATTFLTQVRQDLRRHNDSPTASETTLAAHIAQLERSLAQQERVRTDAVTSVPSVDLRAERDELLDRWRFLREKYRADRAAMIDLARSVEELRTAPAPSHGIVTAHRRDRALAADLGLQQDLKELVVALTEARGCLARVQDDTNALRGQLEDAADALTETLQSNGTSGPPSATAGHHLAQTSGQATAFQNSVHQLATTWAEELTALRAWPIDPHSPGLLERQERLRATLSTFLFDGAKRLAQLREGVERIEAASKDPGLTGTIEADVAKAFQTVQALYHRFEFTASRLDRSHNVRLDAALQSAGGLRRRSQRRIQRIEERLQQEALEQMRTLQASSLQQAQAHLDEVRSENDRTVASLVALQDQLTLRFGSAAAFIEAEARAEMASQGVEALRATLMEAKAHLGRLEAQRKTRGRETTIELVEAGVLGRPENAAERLRNGAVGTLLTLLALLTGQWWGVRRAG